MSEGIGHGHRNRTRNFNVIGNEVYEFCKSFGISPDAMFCLLWMLSNRDGFCYSVRRVASFFSVGETRVKRWSRELQDADLLYFEKQRDGKTKWHYFEHPDDGKAFKQALCSKRTSGSNPATEPYVQNEHVQNEHVQNEHALTSTNSLTSTNHTTQQHACARENVDNSTPMESMELELDQEFEQAAKKIATDTTTTVAEQFQIFKEHNASGVLRNRYQWLARWRKWDSAHLKRNPGYNPTPYEEVNKGQDDKKTTTYKRRRVGRSVGW